MRRGAVRWTGPEARTTAGRLFAKGRPIRAGALTSGPGLCVFEGGKSAPGPKEVRELQGELARLRADSQELARLRALEQQREQDADYAAARSWLTRADAFKTWLDAHPEQQLPEFQYLFQDTWLDVVKDTD